MNEYEYLGCSKGDVQVELAECFGAAGNPARALELWEAARADPPLRTINLAKLAWADFRQGAEPGRVEKLLRTLLAQDQASAWGWHYLGRLQMEVEQYDAAEESLMRAAEAEPGHTAVWHRLGELLVAMRNLEEGTECLVKAVTLSETNAEAWLLLGDAYSLRGQMRNALNCYQRLDQEDAMIRDRTSAILSHVTLNMQRWFRGYICRRDLRARKVPRSATRHFGARAPLRAQELVGQQLGGRGEYKTNYDFDHKRVYKPKKGQVVAAVGVARG